MRTRFLLIGLLAAFAIAQKPGDTTLAGWSAETFDLPPGFAPSLPKGKETLRFAPGWRTPGDHDFWSYAFVMWIDEPAPNARRLDALLETYYNGLLNMFAEGEKKDIRSTPAQVDVKRISEGKFEAKMRAIDAFSTFKPVEINFKIECISSGKRNSSVRIQLSPQPKNHAIWKSLDAAIKDILVKEKSASK